jgi:hypothetical protein
MTSHPDYPGANAHQTYPAQVVDLPANILFHPRLEDPALAMFSWGHDNYYMVIVIFAKVAHMNRDHLYDF